jgi:putative addiction module CopG family antidote
MTRSSIEINLPDPLHEFVEKQVAEGRYGDPGAYVREVLTQEQRRHARAEVDEMLLEALAYLTADLIVAPWVVAALLLHCSVIYTAVVPRSISV